MARPDFRKMEQASKNAPFAELYCIDNPYWIKEIARSPERQKALEEHLENIPHFRPRPDYRDVHIHLIPQKDGSWYFLAI